MIGVFDILIDRIGNPLLHIVSKKEFATDFCRGNREQGCFGQESDHRVVLFEFPDVVFFARIYQDGIVVQDCLPVFPMMEYGKVVRPYD